MADNNLFFKVLAQLSDTEYFTFFFLPPLVENSTFLFFLETLPLIAILIDEIIKRIFNIL